MTTVVPPHTLFQGVRAGWSLLNARERRLAFFLSLSVGVNSLFQTVALAGIVPFVQVVMEPDSFEKIAWAKTARDYLGLETESELLAGVGLALLALVIAKNAYSLFHVGLQNWFSAICETRLGTSLLGDVLHAAYGSTLTRNSALIFFQKFLISFADNIAVAAGLDPLVQGRHANARIRRCLPACQAAGQRNSNRVTLESFGMGRCHGLSPLWQNMLVKERNETATGPI